MSIERLVLQEVKQLRMLQDFLSIMRCLEGATATSRHYFRRDVYVAPTPDANYMFRIYYDMVPQEFSD